MAETLTAPSGLVSRQGARVPLVGVVARAEIRDYACRLVLSQRFRNDEDVPIEAVYMFPLDEGAAVCGFEVEIDGRASSAGSRSARRPSRPTTRRSPRATAPTSSTRSAPTSSPRASATSRPARRRVLRLTTVSELPARGRRHPLHPARRRSPPATPRPRTAGRRGERGRAGEPARRAPGALRPEARGGRRDDALPCARWSRRRTRSP